MMTFAISQISIHARYSYSAVSGSLQHAWSVEIPRRGSRDLGSLCSCTYCGNKLTLNFDKINYILFESHSKPCPPQHHRLKY